MSENMEKGLVSIITPMYKGAEFVGDTIESVLKQTYTNWEISWMIVLPMMGRGSTS